MKIHITNLYNFNSPDVLVAQQHQFADVGLELGFREMGIFSYPVDTDTHSELHKRLDGIIAALEYDDLVFIQLPTKNGYIYEELLFNKIKAYSNTKIVFILHDTKMLSDDTDVTLRDNYISLYQRADGIIVPSTNERKNLNKLGISSVLFYDNVCIANAIANLKHNNQSSLEMPPDYISLCQSDFYIKKLFLDSIHNVFEKKSKVAQASILLSEDEIHIGFGLHDKTGDYSFWAGVAMQSIIDHTNSKICFHILHDETLNEKNRYKFVQVATNGGHRVLFHLLNSSQFDDVKPLMSFYTIGAMFRIMLPEVLPELSKIIYLDADLLVNRDIRELWDIDISQYALAAVPDEDVMSGMVGANVIWRNEVPRERYFNSGVLFMNLTRIRQLGNMKEDILAFLARTKEDILPDQDALNYIYLHDTLLLDGSWNYFTKTARRNNITKLEKKIYHYVGTRCVLYYFSEIEKYYLDVLSRTPWASTDCSKILNNTMYRILDRVQQLENLLTQVSVGKKRIYYGNESFAMKNLFSLLPVQKGDYRILPGNDTFNTGILPCKEFSELLKEEKGTFIVLVLPEADNGTAITRLEQIGLEKGIDYFAIPCLLLPHLGGYM